MLAATYSFACLQPTTRYQVVVVAVVDARHLIVNDSSLEASTSQRRSDHTHLNLLLPLYKTVQTGSSHIESELDVADVSALDLVLASTAVTHVYAHAALFLALRY